VKRPSTLLSSTKEEAEADVVIVATGYAELVGTLVSTVKAAAAAATEITGTL